MDPSTKRPLVILGIVVAVAVALFVFGTAHGLGDSRGGSGCSPAESDAWRERLLRPEPVAAGEIQGCTTAAGTFAVPGECTLEIAAAEVRSRRLVVNAIDPIGLTVITDADGRRMRMRPEIKQGQKTEIFIGKEGKTVIFRCLTGVTCRARID